jgi:orotidine-5'-phosphate decarboxylase
MRNSSFVDRFNTLAAERSPFCLGLDPTPSTLASWGLSDDVSGLKTFVSFYLDCIGDELAVLKPQSAYFERFGAAGIAVLEQVFKEVRNRGTLVILDAKRGDIRPTMEGYADAYFGEGSSLQVDALTVTAYLGFDALAPVIERAALAGGHVFVVVASSNPEGRALQAAQIDGMPIYRHLGNHIVAVNNETYPDARPCGAVVGATRTDLPADWLQSLGDTLLLSPGIGRQGATIADMSHRPYPKSIIPTASRSVSDAGLDRQAFGAALRAAKADAAVLWR